MEIKQAAMVGTLESSDIQISISPNPGGGLDIQLQSVVKAQFGDAIIATITEVLEDFGIKDAMVCEVSGDYGCGVKYFSQDAVIKLAPRAGIELDETLSPAEKLKVVQGLMEKDDSRAADIYDTMGTYFGYAIAYYSLFYDINHVIIMGRVTSGKGGTILLAKANEVLEKEFPEVYNKVKLHIPDKKARRVGQSVAAASLPEIIK